MNDIEEANIFDKVKSVIIDYTKEENTDYAILLNGDWGCGKTHFINEILKEALKNEVGAKKELLYISAAGIKDTTEFINGIYFKLLFKGVDEKKLDIAKKSGKGIVKALKTLIPNDSIKYLIESGSTILPNIMKDRVKFSNTLIVIDDLERISETIKIEDFLYRIYDTFISKTVKVLFVANESEIDKKNNEESEYKKIKEKVIRHTISLHVVETTGSEEENYKSKSFESIIGSIAQDKLQDTEYIKNHFIDETFFNEHIENLKHLFNERKHFNLRTFITYLDLAKKILLIDDRLKEHKDILIKLLNALCFVLIELNSDNRKLFNDYFFDKDLQKKIIALRFNQTVTGKKEDEDEDEERYSKYSKDIQKISIPIDLGLHIIESPVSIFIKYTETGYLDEEAIKKEYNHIIIQDNEYKGAYNTLKHGIYLEEEDLRKAIRVIVSKIDSNPNYLHVENFIYISNYLENFHYLLDSNEYEKIKNNIKNNVEDQISKYNRVTIQDYYDFRCEDKCKSPELRSIIKEAMELASKKMNIEFRKNLLDIFNN